MRVAPIALRTPISRVRSATETSMMLRMPIPATTSETAPIRATMNVVAPKMPSTADANDLRSKV